LSFLFDNVFKELFGRLPLARIGRHEHQASRVFTLRWQLDALIRLHHLAEKLIRHLNENPGPVSRVRIGTAGTTMNHLIIHRERLLDDVVGTLALEVCDETHATGILFHGRFPQALLFGPAKRCRF